MASPIAVDSAEAANRWRLMISDLFGCQCPLETDRRRFGHARRKVTGGEHFLQTAWNGFPEPSPAHRRARNLLGPKTSRAPSFKAGRLKCPSSRDAVCNDTEKCPARSGKPFH